MAQGADADRVPELGPEAGEEIGEGEFRNRFVGHMADEIGKAFYPHDRYGRKPNSIDYSGLDPG